MSTTDRERGGIVTGWLVRLILSLAVLGLGLYEAGAVIVAHIAADQVSSEAAREAGAVFGTTNRKTPAREAAADIAARSGATLESVEFVRDEVVLATVTKTAPTLILGRIGFFKKWTTATATGKGAIT